jgi:hypothetical protein
MNCICGHDANQHITDDYKAESFLCSECVCLGFTRGPKGHQPTNIVLRPTLASTEPRTPIDELRAAYKCIPAGTPSDDRVLVELPRLYAAIEGVLNEKVQYAGAISVLQHAEEQGFPIHVATRSTCAEHIEEGDDRAESWALQPSLVLDVERLAEAMHNLRYCKASAMHFFIHGDEPEDLKLRAALAAEYARLGEPPE